MQKNIVSDLDTMFYYKIDVSRLLQQTPHGYMVAKLLYYEFVCVCDNCLGFTIEFC